MSKDFTPLPEHAYSRMMFRVRGGPFGGQIRPVDFKPPDKATVGQRFLFAVSEELARASLKRGPKRVGVAEYQVTKLATGDWETGLQTEPGELTWVNEKGELEQ